MHTANRRGLVSWTWPVRTTTLGGAVIVGCIYAGQTAEAYAPFRVLHQGITATPTPPNPPAQSTATATTTATTGP